MSDNLRQFLLIHGELQRKYLSLRDAWRISQRKIRERDEEIQELRRRLTPMDPPDSDPHHAELCEKVIDLESAVQELRERLGMEESS